MTSDDVLFTVIADGIEGEQRSKKDEGIFYKGDVKLTIKATDRKTGRAIKIPRKPKGSEINFSLKSDSITLENRGPYGGMLEIAEKFGISITDLNKYKPLTIRISGAKGTPIWYKQIEVKKKLVRLMYNEIIFKLEKLDRKDPFTARCFAFLKRAAFGKDEADIIDISNRLSFAISECIDGMCKCRRDRDTVIGYCKEDNTINNEKDCNSRNEKQSP